MPKIFQLLHDVAASSQLRDQDVLGVAHQLRRNVLVAFLHLCHRRCVEAGLVGKCAGADERLERVGYPVHDVANVVRDLGHAP